MILKKKLWLCCIEHGAIPLDKYNNDEDTEIDDIDTGYDAAYPEFRTSQKAKSSYSPYKARRQYGRK